MAKQKLFHYDRQATLLRGHFRRIPGQYGVAFDVEPSGSQS